MTHLGMFWFGYLGGFLGGFGLRGVIVTEYPRLHARLSNRFWLDNTCTRPLPHICTANGPCNGFPKEGAQLAEAVLAESASVQAEITNSAEELNRHQQWCRENIHVYEVCEDIWVAAEGPEAAALFAFNEGLADDEMLEEFGEPVPLTKEIMVAKKFSDETRPEIDTFQKAFDDLLYHGQDFPVVFATVL